MRASLEQLNALGLAVRAAHPITVADRTDRKMSAIIGARWAATDEALRALGIEPHRSDEYGNSRGPHDWYTAQLAGDYRPGLICGIWSGSLEQAIAELAESHGAPVAWAVLDNYPSPILEHYQRKYRQHRNDQTIAPVTSAPEAVVLPAPRVVQDTLF